MILQSLAEYYEALCARPGSGICAPGWSSAKVTAALELDADGHLTGVLSLKRAGPAGGKSGKEKLIPAEMVVPQQEKRASGITPNFLCDNFSYLLGADEKGDAVRASKCFAASRARHHVLLDGVDSPAAKAVLSFFDTWDPAGAADDPILQAAWKEISGGGNLVFRFDGEDVLNDETIRKAWQNSRRSAASDGDGICLVTGRRGPIARLHTNLKGVQGAQSSGAALVSFNKQAFESYEKTQSFNAPVSEEGMFAYTTALNYLLADRDHRWTLGDTTVVFWAQNAQPAYADAFAALTSSLNAPGLTETDLQRLLDTMCLHACCDVGELHFDPDMTFCVLGLAPNAARVSVRFFYRNTFGTLLTHLQRHRQRMEIIRPPFDDRKELSLWQTLRETVNQKAKNPSPSPEMAGAVLQAILNDSLYPESLRQAVMLRLKAEREVTRGRAAILKAFLTKKAEWNSSSVDPQFKEVLQMKHGVTLNRESTYLPYLLGRSFAVLESAQHAANPNVTATIRDRYFNSACATPSLVFPTLMKLHGSHRKVLMRDKPGLGVRLEKELAEIIGSVDENYPARLNLDEQGAFIIGYYHETQSLYTKKEENSNV